VGDSAALAVTMIEANGAATSMQAARWSADKAMAVFAERGDADADGRVTGTDFAVFDALPKGGDAGLAGWRRVDPELLRPLFDPARAERPDPMAMPGLAGAGLSGGLDGTARPAGDPLALSRAFDAPRATLDAGRDRLFRIAYSRPVTVCFVPASETALSPRAEMCFRGSPADLATEPRLWRKAEADPPGENALCVPGERSEADLFRLVPAPPELELPAREALPGASRMCFEPVTPDELAPPPRESAALVPGLAEQLAPLAAFALAPGLRPAHGRAPLRKTQAALLDDLVEERTPTR
jgi:hypothetical protein